MARLSDAVTFLLNRLIKNKPLALLVVAVRENAGGSRRIDPGGLNLYFLPNAGWATMAWMAARRE